MKFALHILIVLCYSVSYGQSFKDSLLNVWENESLPDTSRLKAVEKLHAEVYAKISPDSAFHFASLQYEFAKKGNYDRFQASALLAQGYALRLLGKP